MKLRIDWVWGAISGCVGICALVFAEMQQRALACALLGAALVAANVSGHYGERVLCQKHNGNSTKI